MDQVKVPETENVGGPMTEAPLNDFSCFDSCSAPVQPPFELLAFLAFALFITVPMAFALDWIIWRLRPDN